MLKKDILSIGKRLAFHFIEKQVPAKELFSGGFSLGENSLFTKNI